MRRKAVVVRRITVGLDAELDEALEALRHGTSLSHTVREAVFLAWRLAPVLDRLDRIEGLLRAGVTVAEAPCSERPMVDMREVMEGLLAFGQEDGE